MVRLAVAGCSAGGGAQEPGRIRNRPALRTQLLARVAEPLPANPAVVLGPPELQDERAAAVVAVSLTKPGTEEGAEALRRDRL